VLGIYNSHTEAEASIKELQRSGFDMKKLSIVGKDYHTEEHVIGYYNVGDRMKVWGKLGAFWGGFWGLLFGSAMFFIPGIGPLIVFGPLVGWIVGTPEGAAVVGSLSARPSNIRLICRECSPRDRDPCCLIANDSEERSQLLSAKIDGSFHIRRGNSSVIAARPSIEQRRSS
jgi:hypothetical protein